MLHVNYAHESVLNEKCGNHIPTNWPKENELATNCAQIRTYVYKNIKYIFSCATCIVRVEAIKCEIHVSSIQVEDVERFS